MLFFSKAVLATLFIEAVQSTFVLNIGTEVKSN